MLLDNARPLLNLQYVEAWPALGVYRAQLTAAMQDFQRYKHDAIFDPIIAIGRGDRPIAQNLKTACIMLGAEYDGFRQQWAKKDVSANWPEYRLSAISMMTTIRKSFYEQDAVIRTLAPV